MKLFTSDEQAKTAATSYARQYADLSPSYRLANGLDPRDTLRQLRALGPNPDPAKVDYVIGNRSWTTTRCDECFKDELMTAVAIGDSTLCIECLTQACALVFRAED